MWLDRFRSTLGTTKITDRDHSYQPRAARFNLDIALSFAEEEYRYEGQCVNVSEYGLLARFPNTPGLWTVGKVEFEAGEYILNIHARVTRLEANDVGFAFHLQTADDRAAIAILLNFVAGSVPDGLAAKQTAGDKRL